MKLLGKVALVTGSSRGIGKAVALALAKEGADVVIVARTEHSADSPYQGTIHETAEEIRALGRRALTIRTDLRLPEEVQQMCRTALEELGRVDIFVHNAWHNAWYDGKEAHLQHFTDVPVEYWNDVFAVHVTAPWIASKELVPQMIERGNGTILFTTSFAAIGQGDVPPGQAGFMSVAYGPSKAALNRLTLYLASDLRPHNIPVIAVDPGFTRTPSTEARHGPKVEQAHSVDVPARTMLHLCTCPDPMWFSGKVVVAQDFVREHALL